MTTEETVTQDLTPITEEQEALLAKHINNINNISSLYSSVANIPCQAFTLFPNFVKTKINGMDKSISLLDFKSILDSLLKTESKLVGLSLPFNCFSLAQSANEIRLSCYYPESKQTLNHIPRSTDKSSSYKLPFPNMIISHKLVLKEGFWSVVGSRFYCTNKKVTQLPENEFIWDKKPSEGIWCVPFPNFYDNGNMCYGRNTMPVKFTNNLRGLDYYYQVILQSPFNDDLGISGTKTRYEPKVWFKHLSGLNEFPYSELVEK